MVAEYHPIFSSVPRLFTTKAQTSQTVQGLHFLKLQALQNIQGHMGK